MEDLDSIKKRQANDKEANKGKNLEKGKSDSTTRGDGIVFDAGDGAKKTNTPKKPQVNGNWKSYFWKEKRK